MTTEPERLGPYDIVSADATIALTPDEDGVVPVRDQQGNVIGCVTSAALDRATGSVMADIELDQPLKNGQSMTFQWTVTIPVIP